MCEVFIWLDTQIADIQLLYNLTKHLLMQAAMVSVVKQLTQDRYRVKSEEDVEPHVVQRGRSVSPRPADEMCQEGAPIGRRATASWKMHPSQRSALKLPCELWNNKVSLSFWK